MMAYIFAYGSLMNRSEIARTLDRNVSDEDYHFAELHAYVRSWGAVRNNHRTVSRRVAETATGKAPECVSYLNLKPASEGRHVYGVCFRVNEHELRHLDHREAGYSRVDVSHCTRIHGIDAHENEGAKIYAYISEEHGDVPRSFLNYHYLNLIHDTATHVDQSFPGLFRNYLENTLFPGAMLGDFVVYHFNHAFDTLHVFSTEDGQDRPFIHFGGPVFSDGGRGGANRVFVENARHGDDWLCRFDMARAGDFTHDDGIGALATDASFLVRLALCMNHTTPHSVLRALSSDVDVWVERAAVAALEWVA